MKKNTFLLPISCTLLFFILVFLTLPDYGTSWDETIHFRRGQAYLYYFLTGKTNYSALPKLDLQGTRGNPREIAPPRRSYYQNDIHNGEYFLNRDIGHPPISGELAALSNYIFFQKLGILDDISAYHIFNILASSLLIFVVVLFASSTFGMFPAIISFLALMTYPLFWAEAHFNIKDPPQAAFFAATIWTFYKSLKKSHAGWLLTSFIFFALGLGTKFNIVFLPLVVVLYLVFRYRPILPRLVEYFSSISRSYLSIFLVGPLFVTIIFVGTWPFLWEDWPANFFRVLRFYKEIGIGTRYQPEEFFIAGFNTFPLQWILFTTPPLSLFLFVIGVVAAFLKRNLMDKVTILWLLWLIVPIARVTVPGASIYGGSRQILEFLPALALVCGLGAWQLFEWAKKFRRLHPKKLHSTIGLILLLSFIWPIYVLIRMHPNQNVYFNFLIGGLAGAQERNFPSWGNSYGNAYKQGIDWLNKNAEYSAKLALIQGTPSNAPPILLRSDINYLVGGNVDSRETYFSGIDRKGEYLMELTFNDTGKAFYYTWEYVDKFLQPLYELKVDGVPILKIWKNDLVHTRPEYRIEEKQYTRLVNLSHVGQILNIRLKEEIRLSRIRLAFLPTEDCDPIITSFVETSLDGQNWIREKDWIPFPQVSLQDNREGNTIIFFLVDKKARFIRIIFDSPNSCGLNKPSVEIKIF